MSYGRKITRRQERVKHLPICPECGAITRREKQDFVCPNCETRLDAAKWSNMSKSERHWILKG